MINKNTMVNMLNIAIVKLLKILVSSKLQHHAKTKKTDKIPSNCQERQKDGQTLFHRTLPTTSGGPKIAAKQRLAVRNSPLFHRELK